VSIGICDITVLLNIYNYFFWALHMITTLCSNNSRTRGKGRQGGCWWVVCFLRWQVEDEGCTGATTRARRLVMHCSRVVEPTVSQLNLVLPFGVCYLELKSFLLFLLLMRDKIMNNSFHEQRVGINEWPEKTKTCWCWLFVTFHLDWDDCLEHLFYWCTKIDLSWHFDKNLLRCCQVIELKVLTTL
jgi:hypothetical protein